MDDSLSYLYSQFKDHYEVRVTLERMHGGLTLTLANQRGLVARRVVSNAQLADRQKLERVVQSIRFGMAIDAGCGLVGLRQLDQPAHTATHVQVS